MAAPNSAVFVSTGLLYGCADDEVALVLARELVHMTHEHARRRAKKGFWGGLVRLGGLTVARQIESDGGGAVASLAAEIGGIAVQKGYSRKCEEQADRVGLRYVFEAGYDVNRAMQLAERFAARPGAGHYYLGTSSARKPGRAGSQRSFAARPDDGALDDCATLSLPET